MRISITPQTKQLLETFNTSPDEAIRLLHNAWAENQLKNTFINKQELPILLASPECKNIIETICKSLIEDLRQGY